MAGLRSDCEVAETHLQFSISTSQLIQDSQTLGSVHLKSVGGGGHANSVLDLGGGQVNSALDLGGSCKFHVHGKKPVTLHLQIIIYLLKR